MLSTQVFGGLRVILNLLFVGIPMDGATGPKSNVGQMGCGSGVMCNFNVRGRPFAALDALKEILHMSQMLLGLLPVHPLRPADPDISLTAPRVQRLALFGCLKLPFVKWIESFESPACFRQDVVAFTVYNQGRVRSIKCDPKGTAIEGIRV